MDDYSTLKLTRTIAALFDDAGQADDARQELADAGFVSVDITRNTDEPSAEAKPIHEHSFWAKVKAFFAGEEHDAHAYGEGIRRGGTLVTVHTTDDQADTAIEILDRYDPANLDDYQSNWRADGWEGGAHSSVAGDTSIIDTPTITDFDKSVSGEDASDFDNTASSGVGSEAFAPVSQEQLIGGRRDVDRGTERVRSYYTPAQSPANLDANASRPDDADHDIESEKY